MPRFRFSLLALFGFVAAIAAACAALATPNEFWETVVSSAALMLLVFAPLAAIYGQKTGRAFWVGFAMVGWAYSGAQHFKLTRGLPTNRIERKLQEAVHPEQWQVLPGGTRDLLNGNAMKKFRTIAGWLWPIILGFAGGHVARYLYLRREWEKTLPKN